MDRSQATSESEIHKDGFFLTDVLGAGLGSQRARLAKDLENVNQARVVVVDRMQRLNLSLQLEGKIEKEMGVLQEKLAKMTSELQTFG